ncbi:MULTISPECIES: hypothetical protein [unclassified Streptomyces]|uniref:hypothetical protein n=1 Tax=unclassified Streptomyces TaxID=2593676 RepID=UPI0035D6D635
MTIAPEPWTPFTVRTEDTATLALTLPGRPFLLPQKPALPNGLAITRRSRFPLPANGSAAIQARTIVRSVLRLILGSGDAAERVSRRVETCLAELVAVAYTHSAGEDLLCAVWVDADHIFMSVEHDQALPAHPDETTMGLNLVKTIASDYGTHFSDGTHQTWAAVPQLG